MNTVFKRSTAINGNFKNVAIYEGEFVDYETHEVIPVAKILESVYGEDNPFDIKTLFKSDFEVDPELE